MSELCPHPVICLPSRVTSGNCRQNKKAAPYGAVIKHAIALMLLIVSSSGRVLPNPATAPWKSSI